MKKTIKKQDDTVDKKELKLFGSDFFNTFQSSFMPINDPNPGSFYILDVNDVLTIQLIGQQNSIENYSIKSDGSINLPKIGKVVLAGNSLINAVEIIKAQINSAFIGTEAFVTLDKLRDINILVAGNANKPGVYTLKNQIYCMQ